MHTENQEFVPNPKFYIKDIQEQIEGQRVLDIGCCATHEKNNLKRHIKYEETAGEIIGLDINKEYIKKGLEKHPNLELLYCDVTDKKQVEKLIPTIGRFDHVIATDIIEHVGNLTNLLDNIRLFMTPQGNLYLTAPNCRSIFRHAMWTKRIPYLANHDHICWFDIETLTTLLARSGFYVHQEMYCALRNDINLAERFGIPFHIGLSNKIYLIVRKEEASGLC